LDETRHLEVLAALEASGLLAVCCRSMERKEEEELKALPAAAEELVARMEPVRKEREPRL
jgi:hypothetical protein